MQEEEVETVTKAEEETTRLLTEAGAEVMTKVQDTAIIVIYKDMSGKHVSN